MNVPRSAVALISCLLLASASRADVKEISVTVKGVTCPVCTHSINIGLRSVAGVKTVKISLATRVDVEVTPRVAAWIDPARIIGQIALVGFQAKTDEVMLHLEGDASMQDGQLTLILSDVAPGPVHLLLVPAEQSGSRAQEVAKTLARLQNDLTSGDAYAEHVQVEGWWRPVKDRVNPATLLVTKLTLSPSSKTVRNVAP